MSIDIQVKSYTSIKKSDCVIVPVQQPNKLTKGGLYFDKLAKGAISQCIQQENFKGANAKTLFIPSLSTACQRAILVGVGTVKELTLHQYKKMVHSALAPLKAMSVKEAVCLLPEINVKGQTIAQTIRLISETLLDQLYRFNRYKKAEDKIALKKLIIIVQSSQLVNAKQAVVEAQAISQGKILAKNLANTPANDCTPTVLAEEAKQLAKAYPKLKVKVLDRHHMEKEGMHSLLSVAQGSQEPPKLIVLQYEGAAKKQKPIALVGKGVTFDSGGISLKPSAKMDEMKYDMCGSASVLGTFKAVCEMGLAVNLLGIIPATENMPSGSATKPGDIVTSLSGKTVEILNTDAEGRLILCDALTYCERFNPDVVIDIATLTGACVVALGRHPSAVLSNDQPLADALLDAGEQSYDRCWQLPLWDEYQSQIDSPFADMANIGGAEAGTVTAACFLSRFTKKFRWAHLDIAGTAWVGGAHKGATGRPVPLLTQYIINRATR